MLVDAAVLNAATDAVVDLADVGANAAKVQFWSGAMPGTLGGTPAGDLLVEFDLQDPAFGAAAGGIASALGVPLTATGVDDGDMGWFQVLDADGDPLWSDDDIVVSPANGAAVVSTKTVSVGLTVNLVSYQFWVAAP